MKIRHPALLKAGGFAAAAVIKALVASLRFRSRWLDPSTYVHGPGQESFIYSFWHEDILIPAYHYGWARLKVIISTHADGELIAQACRFLEIDVVRGSTTRGGVHVLREILALKNR